jgi:hypothetical protein
LLAAALEDRELVWVLVEHQQRRWVNNVSLFQRVVVFESVGLDDDALNVQDSFIQAL